LAAPVPGSPHRSEIDGLDDALQSPDIRIVRAQANVASQPAGLITLTSHSESRSPTLGWQTYRM
jgi:hypothetical protein